MPIYEYKCNQCQHGFEKLVKMSAPAPQCPKCGANEPKKMVSVGSFVLRGDGWYKDHYGLKGGQSNGGASGEKES